MMAMTTSSSISVKPRRDEEKFEFATHLTLLRTFQEESSRHSDRADARARRGSKYPSRRLGLDNLGR